MQVTIEIPDAYAAELASAGKDPARVAFEALLVEGYRTGHIHEGDIRQSLGFTTPMQVHALLHEHQVPLQYSVEDLKQDRITSEHLRGAGPASVAA